MTQIIATSAPRASAADSKAVTLQFDDNVLLALLLVMAWSLPGKAMLDAAWSPTWEGLLAGAGHALRILALVWLMRMVWLAVGQQGVLAGLYCLLCPLAWLGLPVERAGLRLGLTLAYAERLLADPPGFSWANWRRELFGVAQAVPDRVELKLYHAGWRDVVCILLIMAVSGMLMKVWA